jgi:hypothetical protein
MFLSQLKKMKVWCAHGVFILGFMDEITNRLLNIIIFKLFIGDSLSNVPLKISFRTKNFKNPSRFFSVRS